MSDARIDYGEQPDLLELRTRLAATHKARRGSVAQALAGRRDRRDLREAYRALFFGEDGRMRPAAALVLADIAEEAGFGAANMDLNHGEMCVLEGKRRLLLFVLARLRLPPAQAEFLESEMEKSR